MSALTQSPAWQALAAHARAPVKPTGQEFSCAAAGLVLDYSRQRITSETLELLLALARQQDVRGWTERLFGGARVNLTENRAALHVALRARKPVEFDGSDVTPAVRAVLERMVQCASDVRAGRWRGATGKRIRDVVNIGIGGSDLGPRMVCRALAEGARGPRAHFVANVDPADLRQVLAGLAPERTLFIVTSKTFTTQETMANARRAREWLTQALGEAAVARHFVAVSTNLDAVAAFGIAPANMFEFWDWVGGRYSLWSAVGLSIVLAPGPPAFRRLLAGAEAMDRHFRTAPAARNLPVLMGLLGVWNNNFLGCASHVVVPYAQRLEKFPAWLQQLEMESNGKRIDRGGVPVDYATTPVLWGDVGTNAQHAFFQMLHQGPALHSIDFIFAVDDLADPQQRMLAANLLAQGAALERGRAADDPHRVYPGGRPSSTLLLPSVDAYHLGALLALYEHRAFVQSVIWNINPFDQWGVELGKQIASDVLAALEGGSAAALDETTKRLLARIRAGTTTAGG